MKRTVVGVAVAVALLVAACGSDTPTYQGTSDLSRPEGTIASPENPGTVPAGDFLTTPGAAQRAIDTIVREVRPRRVRYVNMYDSYVIFEAQDPAKPENIDRYTYRYGRVGDFEPVNVSGQTQEDIEADLFGITDVDWGAMPGLAKTLQTQTDLEGGKVVLASVERNQPLDPNVRISMSMNGTRRNAALEATADGTVLGVRVTSPIAPGGRHGGSSRSVEPRERGGTGDAPGLGPGVLKDVGFESLRSHPVGLKAA